MLVGRVDRRWLGIDYGQRRIGLALAEAQVAVARPLVTLTNDDHLQHRLAGIITEHAVTDLVVGWPRNLDGDETAQSRAAEGFAAELKSFGLPVYLQDEALTSELAGPVPKDQIDQAAAAMILQDYLDAR